MNNIYISASLREISLINNNDLLPVDMLAIVSSSFANLPKYEIITSGYELIKILTFMYSATLDEYVQMRYHQN